MRDKILDSINDTDKPYLVVVLFVFALMVGFFFGNVAHDTMFHGIEQSINKARE